jgi:hypothetical protein
MPLISDPDPRITVVTVRCPRALAFVLASLVVGVLSLLVHVVHWLW